MTNETGPGADKASRRRQRRDAKQARKASLETRIEVLGASLTARHTEVSKRLDELARRLAEADARAHEGYRRQAGFLDVFRRQQQAADEADAERVAALEAVVLATSSRLAAVEAGVNGAESSIASIVDHLGALDTFRVDLGNIIERMSAALAALRESSEALAARIDAAEAVTRQHAAESAVLLEQVDTGRRAADALAGQIALITSDVAAAVERLERTEATLTDRSVLDFQLDRAEAVERLLSEVDPDRFASRDDLEQLRRQLGAPALPPDLPPTVPPTTHHSE
jgi:chromosome segregation ATPase